MKALTLHQPWASLIALGVKTIETRSWSTKYRGPLAIHAGLKGAQGELDLFSCERDGSGYLLRGPIAWPYRLPLGAIVATCTLVDVVLIDSLEHDAEAPREYERIVDFTLHQGLSHLRRMSGGWGITNVEDQRPFGDFTPGRFAWLLADVVRTETPAKGKQGLWNWDLP